MSAPRKATSALRVIAAPTVVGSTRDQYERLAAVERAAYALFRHVIEYRAIPAHPENADYRARQLALIAEDEADMQKALTNG